ncbi:MAG: hypothetical protein RIA71_15965 [Oceanicaulis sp.]
MNNFTMGAGQIRDTYSADGAAQEDAAHSAKMQAVSDAHVETFTNTRSTPAVVVNSETFEGQTRGDRVTDSLKVTAGGTDAYNALFAFAEQRGDHALLSSWNAAVAEAVQGDSAVKRHNAQSRAESILIGLKQSHARANQPEDDGPKIDIIR